MCSTPTTTRMPRDIDSIASFDDDFDGIHERTDPSTVTM